MPEWRSTKIEDGLGTWSGDWDRLNRDLYSEHPLFDSRFIDGLLKYFGTGNERLLVYAEHGMTAGMIILTRRPRGVWEIFLPSQLQVAPVLVSRAEILSGLFDVLPNLTWQITFLSQDPTYTPLRSSRHTNMAVSRTRHALTMAVDTKSSFEEFWRTRPSKLRQNIRRYKSRAERASLEGRIEKLTGSFDMGAAIERYGILETSGWKGKAGTAVSIDNVQGAFYRDILEKYAETGQAIVYEYYLGDKLASSRLLLCGPKIIVALKTTYDESARRYSPGRILLYETLAREVQEDSKQESIEFYTSATRDQLEWSSSQRWIHHVCLFRNPILRQIQELASLRHRIHWRKS